MRIMKYSKCWSRCMVVYYNNAQHGLVTGKEIKINFMKDLDCIWNYLKQTPATQATGGSILHGFLQLINWTCL